jgi:uncharacterized Zn finger protein
MRTLAEIALSFRVYGTCFRCERQELIDHETIAQKQGDMAIPYFRTRVKCMSCGERSQDIRIVYVGKTGFGYRDH